MLILVSIISLHGLPKAYCLGMNLSFILVIVSMIFRILSVNVPFIVHGCLTLWFASVSVG